MTTTHPAYKMQSMKDLADFFKWPWNTISICMIFNHRDEAKNNQKAATADDWAQIEVAKEC